MTLGSARALVRTARKDGHTHVDYKYVGDLDCEYAVVVDGRSFRTREQYEDWKREQVAKESEAQR